MGTLVPRNFPLAGLLGQHPTAQLVAVDRVWVLVCGFGGECPRREGATHACVAIVVVFFSSGLGWGQHAPYGVLAALRAH